MAGLTRGDKLAGYIGTVLGVTFAACLVVLVIAGTVSLVLLMMGWKP